MVHNPGGDWNPGRGVDLRDPKIMAYENPYKTTNRDQN